MGALHFTTRVWISAAIIAAVIMLFFPSGAGSSYGEGGYYSYGQGYYYGYAQGYYYGYGQGYYAPANSWQTTAAACGASGQFQTSEGTCSLAARTQKCR